MTAKVNIIMNLHVQCICTGRNSIVMAGATYTVHYTLYILNMRVFVNQGSGPAVKKYLYTLENLLVIVSEGKVSLSYFLSLRGYFIEARGAYERDKIDIEFQSSVKTMSLEHSHTLQVHCVIAKVQLPVIPNRVQTSSNSRVHTGVQHMIINDIRT